jgi:hypothetical protein
MPIFQAFHGCKKNLKKIFSFLQPFGTLKRVIAERTFQREKTKETPE